MKPHVEVDKEESSVETEVHTQSAERDDKQLSHRLPEVESPLKSKKTKINILQFKNSEEEDVVSFGKNPNLKLPVKENATLSYVENDPTELETPRG